MISEAFPSPILPASGPLSVQERIEQPWTVIPEGTHPPVTLQ